MIGDNVFWNREWIVGLKTEAAIEPYIQKEKVEEHIIV
jgi:hypothetical protein